MKTEHRIPTITFGYVSVYIDAGEELTPEVIKGLVDDHTRLTEAFNAPQGVEEGLQGKEWLRFQENVLNGVDNHTETLEKMSKAQRWWYNETKKTLKRLEAKEQPLQITE